MTGKFSERLNRLLASRELEQKQLAAEIGVTPQAVNRWVKGRAVPTGELAVKTARALGVTPGFLSYGDALPPDDSARLLIRRYEFPAACGVDICEQEPAGVELIEVSEIWARRHIPFYAGGPLDAYSIITAHGDSMAPTWTDGSILLVDNRIRRIEHDGLYVFCYDGTTYAKRVARVGRGLRVISDNEHYPPFDIAGEAAQAVLVNGRIIKALNLIDLR